MLSTTNHPFLNLQLFVTLAVLLLVIETIADLIEERDWSQADLAKRLGCTPTHISLLINGKAPITEEIAFKLENVLGSSASFWLNRESQYRAKLAQQEAEVMS